MSREKGKDKSMDMPAMLVCIMEMLHESNKRWERLESMFGVRKGEVPSSVNQIASDVEQRTDQKIEAVSKEISLMTVPADSFEH
jgi:hypothetical protein